MSRPNAQERPGFCAASVWLMMLREGGRWTSAEVSERIGISQQDAANNLRAMEGFGTVKRWDRGDKPGDRVRFGVMIDCKVPRGVALADILACNLQQVAL